MLINRIFKVMILVFIIVINIFPGQAFAQEISPVEKLIGYINTFRESKGLGVLTPNPHLMAAAQAQADYLAKTYNVDKGGDGSIGDRGTSPKDRAYQYGYAPWEQYDVVENWIVLNKDYPLENVLTNDWWRREYQQKNFLDGWGNTNRDIGVGIAQQGSVVFYIVDIGYTFDSAGMILSTNEAGEVFSYTPVLTSTPNPDGSIIHIVKEGESLLLIALSYNVPLQSIREFNGFSTQGVIIFPGQQIVIRKSFSDTSTGQANITKTGQPVSTATTAPSFTPRPPSTATPSPTLLPFTATPTPSPKPSFISQVSLGGVGLLILLLGVIGLVIMLIASNRRQNNQL
jgi:LysM repeat protein